MKYYIIAGEPSGDAYGAQLVRALYKLDKAATVRCWGGNLMENAGAMVIKHYEKMSFMGFWEVFINLLTILEHFRFCKKDILSFSPDVIIYIDYPGFNLRIAKWAKLNGYKNYYYISPQIWAWKENRIKRIKRYIDSLYVILPFEKKYYEEKHHYKVSYFGHPLVNLISKQANTTDFFERNGLSKHKPIIALLPGSRKQEINKMLTIFATIVKEFPQYQFVVAKTKYFSYTKFESYFTAKIFNGITGQSIALFRHAQAAIITSGTATLEAALCKVPMVVCYKTGWLNYQIAKRLIKTNYISLVNLILNKKAVTELIQDDCKAKLISKALKVVLSDSGREAQLTDFIKIRKLLERNNPSYSIAKSIIDDCRSLMEPKR